MGKKTKAFLQVNIWFMYKFARGCRRPKYRLSYLSRLRCLNNRNLFYHSSGGWLSKMKVLAGQVSPKSCLLGWQAAIFSGDLSFLCVHTALVPLVSKSVLTRAACPIGSGHTWAALLAASLNVPSPYTGGVGSYGLHLYEFRRTQFSPHLLPYLCKCTMEVGSGLSV